MTWCRINFNCYVLVFPGPLGIWLNQSLHDHTHEPQSCVTNPTKIQWHTYHSLASRRRSKSMLNPWADNRFNNAQPALSMRKQESILSKPRERSLLRRKPSHNNQGAQLIELLRNPLSKHLPTISVKVINMTFDLPLARGIKGWFRLSWRKAWLLPHANSQLLTSHAQSHIMTYPRVWLSEYNPMLI